jgi:type III pantothenate kinase
MLLAVDAGNSQIALGLFRASRLVRSWRIATEARRTADEYALTLAALLGRAARSVRSCAIASVVPALDPVLRAACRTVTRRAPLVIDHRSPLGFTIGYRPPGDVGADRLVDAAAAVERFGAPVIVADIGTATTLEVVDRRRTYLGGAIAPGPELAAAALFRGTARLPQVDLAGPGAVIGRSTAESLRSGIVLGLAALVDGLLERAFREMGGRPPVVATGGAAPLVAPHSRYLKVVEPDLTLHGIRLVAARMR